MKLGAQVAISSNAPVAAKEPHRMATVRPAFPSKVEDSAVPMQFPTEEAVASKPTDPAGKKLIAAYYRTGEPRADGRLEANQEPVYWP